MVSMLNYTIVNLLKLLSKSINSRKTKSVDDDKLINIKVENKYQIISNFSYDENDILNKYLSDYIGDKSKNTCITQDCQLNIY